MNIKQIVGNIVNKIKPIGDRFKGIKSIIPKRKSEEAPTENASQITKVQEDSFDIKEDSFDIKEEGSQSIISKKKIIIVVAVGVVIFLGLWASGIISMNGFPPMFKTTAVEIEEEGDFELLNNRLNFLEDQMEFMVDQGGESGKQGMPGLQGTQGIPGEKGPEGQSSIPIMFSSGSTKTQLIRPLYIGMGGGSDDYDLIKMIFPTNGIIKNLHVLTVEPRYEDLNDNVYATLILNGEETDLSCYIIKNKCANITTVVKIKAGDMFAIKIDKKEQILFGELIRIQASILVEIEK